MVSRYKIAILAAVLVLCLPSSSRVGAALGSLEEAWEAKYDGPGSTDDLGKAVLLDSEGNVLVLGESQIKDVGYRSATLKYRPDGGRIWVSLEEEFVPRVLGVDSGNNVYVTGWAQSHYTRTGLKTIKYNPDGSRIWATTTDFTTQADPSSIAIDRTGNVSVGVGPAIVQLDGSGQERWVTKLENFTLLSLAVDSEGDVHATGYESIDLTKSQYLTVLLDAAGRKLWEAPYGGGEGGASITYSIVLDPVGNTYVTGTLRGPKEERDIGTLKYDPSGKEVWAKRYDGQGNGLKAWSICSASSSWAGHRHRHPIQHADLITWRCSVVRCHRPAVKAWEGSPDRHSPVGKSATPRYQPRQASR